MTFYVYIFSNTFFFNIFVAKSLVGEFNEVFDNNCYSREVYVGHYLARGSASPLQNCYQETYIWSSNSTLSVLNVWLSHVTPFLSVCWPGIQNPKCIGHTSHNARFWNRNVHTCAHFCYKMVHCGMWDWCSIRVCDRPMTSQIDA